MFSLRARQKLLDKGWSVGAFRDFVRDSWRESLAQIRAHQKFTFSITRFAIALGFPLCLVLALFYLPAPGREYGVCAALAALGIASFTFLTLLNTDLIRRPDGRNVDAFGLANYLTLARFYLIAPVVVLLLQGHLRPALGTYLVLGLTDIADGIVARRRGEQTEFGVVMDPLADVFATAGVFAALYARGLVPSWLFALLMVRYTMLILGSFLFFLVVGPIRFRATIPGKVVGALQAGGISAIVLALVAGPGHLERLGTWLFPFLGLCFASIVVSQAIFAVRERRLRNLEGRQ